MIEIAKRLGFVAAAVLLPASAAAQDTTAQMRQVAAQLRTTAEQMKGQLPKDQIDEMLRSADEIEAGIKSGAYGGPPAAAEPDLATRIAAAHGGRLEWLAKEPACTGYAWENYRTFRLHEGNRDAERDTLCQTAYRHWETYFLTTRNGGNRAVAQQALADYDRAAQAAVDFYNRK